MSRQAPSNLRNKAANRSPCGSAADGVLGCTSDTGEIFLLVGWNWYTGADSGTVGTEQYDFQTIVTHELGHSLGLGHSGNADSVMYTTLSPGVAQRTLAAGDIALAADEDVEPSALLAAPVAFPSSVGDTTPLVPVPVFHLVESIRPHGDRSAAGDGWYVGREWRDESRVTRERRDERREPENSAAGSGLSTLDPRLHMHLLTAVMPELEHLLGLADDYSDLNSPGHINGWLDAAIRRLPTEGELAEILAGK